MLRKQGKSEKKDPLRISCWISSNTVASSRHMDSQTQDVGVKKVLRARNPLHRGSRVIHVDQRTPKTEVSLSFKNLFLP